MAKKTKPKERNVSNENEIEMYLHCAQCIKEKPSGVSQMDWSRTQAGWTKIGLQVWCNRHEINICHIDFQGQQHPENLTRSTTIVIKE